MVSFSFSFSFEKTYGRATKVREQILEMKLVLVSLEFSFSYFSLIFTVSLNLRVFSMKFEFGISDDYVHSYKVLKDCNHK